MPGGAYHVYAVDVAEAIQGPVLSYSSPTVTMTSGGSTNYYPVTAALGMNLAGVLVYASVVITPSTSTTVVAGTDALDQILNGYEVTNQVGGGVRCKVITRKGAEEAERLFLQPGATTTFVYPRASAATFTATNAATTQQLIFFVPAAGGQALNLKFYYPGAGTAFTTSSAITSISTTFYLYAVPTLSTVRTAYQEIISRTLGSGQQDMQADVPSGMSPDFYEIVGTAWGNSSTTISKVVIDAQGGAGRAVDYEDQYAGNAAQTLYPPNGAANQLNILINMHKQRADHLWVTTGTSFSQTIDQLFTELDDGSPLVPEPTAAPSATDPLAKQTASTGTSGQVTPNSAVQGVRGGRFGMNASGTSVAPYR
jgi:hypothetical protein